MQYDQQTPNSHGNGSLGEPRPLPGSTTRFSTSCVGTKASRSYLRDGQLVTRLLRVLLYGINVRLLIRWIILRCLQWLITEQRPVDHYSGKTLQYTFQQ